MESSTVVDSYETEYSHSVSAFSVVTFLIGLLGVIGNGLVLLVIYKNRKLKKSRLQNPFVTNQTCIDLVSSVFLAITFAYKMAPTLQMWGSAGLLLCVSLEGEGLLWIFLSSSAVSLMALTFERYIKIVHPIKHHTSFTTQKKIVIISLSWVLPIVWLAIFIVMTTVVQNGVCLFQVEWPSAILAQFYGWTYIMFSYFIPLFFFIYCYGHMFWTLHKRNVQVREGPITGANQNTGNVSRAQVNIIKTMMIVSCCFAVLWAPAQLYYFSYIIEVYTGDYLSTAYYAFNIICFMNSVINPFIYAMKLHEFRVMVLEIFGIKLAGGPTESQNSPVASRATGISAAPNTTMTTS